MPPALRMRLPLLALISVLCCSDVAFGQPAIASLSPGAAAPGATVDVTVRGGNLAGASQLWTSFPATAELAPDVKDNGKNAGEVVFRLTLPKEAPVGVQGVRVVSPQGVSQLALFVIDDLPTASASGQNTSKTSAQKLSLPTAVEGAIPSLGRHWYQFEAKAGETISFEVLARRIGSPLDPMFRLYSLKDDRARELAYDDDALGLQGDCRLSYRMPADGQYLLQVRDIRFQGSGNHRYRLRIGDFPCVCVPYPMGARRGTEAALQFGGTDVADVQPVKVAVPGNPRLAWMSVGAKRKGGRSSGFATLAVGDSEEALEHEPNDDPAQATRATLGANLNGRFERPGDVDRFVFAAKKGQRYTFDAVTRSQGSPTDLTLELQNAKGAKLAQSDDAGTEDGAITYTFPEDGDYQLVLSDLHRRGGSEFIYRVAVAPVEARFELSATVEHANVPAGGTASIAVVANRQGYNGPIKLEAVDLPDGITSVPTVLGAGLGGVNLTLTGTGKTPTGIATPIRIVGTATVGDKTMTADADVAAALKGIAGGVPFPPLVLSSSLVVAAAPAGPLSVKPETQTVTVPRGKTATVKFTLSRSAEISEAVTLAVPPVPPRNPQKVGLPNGLTIAPATIPKGANEAVVTISAAKSPAGEFTATLVATHKKGNATIAVPAPGIVIQVK